MNLERYEYYANEGVVEFEFERDGKKGKIKKIARFYLMQKGVYNFGFGDLDENTHGVNDIVVSNNGDGDKILATAAAIIVDFTSKFSNAAIFIKGTTPARTRWYQMGINRNWDEIGQIFDIAGYKKGKWEPFQKNHNYEAFLGSRK